MNNFNSIAFTYYGDLLGVSNYYKISQDEAYSKLDFFYNTVSNIFKDLSRSDTTFKIFLFSDSIFITGAILETTLKRLSYLYSTLFQNNILIRGGIVAGKLGFDPRVGIDGLSKKLPTTDVLFRVVELEKRNKGNRILIEKSLAQQILPPSWLTPAGIINNDMPSISKSDIRRKIKLCPNWSSYEYLWPLIDEDEFPIGNKVKLIYKEYVNKLKLFKRIFPEESAANILETKRMINSIQYEISKYYYVPKKEKELEKRKIIKK